MSLTTKERGTEWIGRTAGRQKPKPSPLHWLYVLYESANVRPFPVHNSGKEKEEPVLTAGSKKVQSRNREERKESRKSPFVKDHEAMTDFMPNIPMESVE